MPLLKGVKDKFQENTRNLGLLEAIDAIEQIRSLVIEESQERPYQTREALLQLYQLILTFIQNGFYEESDTDKLLRFLNRVEEDIYRITNHIESIFKTVHQMKNIISDGQEG